MMLLLLATLTVQLQWNRTVLERSAAPPDITIEKQGSKLTFHSSGAAVEPATETIVPGGSVAIEIKRPDRAALPYVLKHDATTGRIEWYTHYRAEGILHISPCQTQIIATDSNGDGILDTLNLGRTFQLCGHQLTLDSIASDGASVTFQSTRIVPKIGEPVPEFSFTTTDGRTIGSSALRGKPTLLDFWASWCDTCIREMPELARLNLNVISINIDPPDHLPKTLPSWTQVLSGIGIADPTWQIFQSLSREGALPLYVLIDEKGVIRQAGTALPGSKAP